MTEESRNIQLTNQINFVPALCGPSKMNTFTIFIQNSSLVDNNSTKYKRYIDMEILNHCLDYQGTTWKVFTDITNYLPHMKKLKLTNHMGTGGLQSFEVNVGPSLLIMS